MRYGLFVLLCLLASCFSRSAAMTGETYSTISLGTPVESLSADIGRPYAIHYKENGIREYEYIERIRNDRSLVSENHYILTIENGKVVSKRMWQEKSRAYNLIYEYDPNYDSYNSFPSSFPSN
ncbi:MAG TPA: hypothetical protein VGJ00_03715 [Rhabdochlamydiaceae bacterium]